jgi:hypothetical protein
LCGEVVCLDPLAWLRAGLVTNPGQFVLGQPGTGKSTLVKRQITGAVAAGGRAVILGDTKPDYTMLTEHLGGQVIRAGRGLDRINPLVAGPVGAALARMTGPRCCAYGPTASPWSTRPPRRPASRSRPAHAAVRSSAGVAQQDRAAEVFAAGRTSKIPLPRIRDLRLWAGGFGGGSLAL